MKESLCLKSQNGCVVKGAFDDYHATYRDYENAKNRQQDANGNGADVNNEIFLYKFLLLQAARETQRDACSDCSFVIADP